MLLRSYDCWKCICGHLRRCVHSGSCFPVDTWFPGGASWAILVVWVRLCQRYLFSSPRLLLELLELLFDKFNAVATAHSVVLGYLQDTVVTPLAPQEDVKLYDMADVWVKIQDVLQVKGPFIHGAILIQNSRLERRIYHLEYSFTHKQWEDNIAVDRRCCRCYQLLLSWEDFLTFFFASL